MQQTNIGLDTDITQHRRFTRLVNNKMLVLLRCQSLQPAAYRYARVLQMLLPRMFLLEMISRSCRQSNLAWPASLAHRRLCGFFTWVKTRHHLDDELKSWNAERRLINSSSFAFKDPALRAHAFCIFIREYKKRKMLLISFTWHVIYKTWIRPVYRSPRKNSMPCWKNSWNTSRKILLPGYQ